MPRQLTEATRRIERSPSPWLLAVLLAVTLMALSTEVVAKPSPDGTDEARAVDADTIRKHLRETAASARKLARYTDTGEPATPEDVLREIPGTASAEEIYEWVGANIEFEPYKGTIRGAKGVLATGAGNAIDQVKLLARLFEEANIEYRFVQGQLHGVDKVGVLRDFAGDVELASADGTDASHLLSKDAAFAGDQFVRLVDEHVWLEAKVDGQFQTVDTVASNLFGHTKAEAETRIDHIPSRYRTEMTVTLHALFSDGQRKELVTIAGPLSGFAYEPIRLQFDSTVVQKEMVIPKVEIQGRTKTGERFLPTDLDRMWVDYDVRTGARESSYRQGLFDRANGQSRFRYRGVVNSLMVVPGWTSPSKMAQVGGEIAERVQKRVGNQLDSTGSDARKLGGDALRHMLSATSVVGTMLYPMHLDAMTGRLADAVGVRPVLTEPRVVHATTMLQEGELALDIEVDGGSLTALPREGVSARAVRAFSSVHGYAQDRLRNAIIKKLTGNDPVSVRDVFRAVRAKRVPVATIFSGNVDALGDVKVTKSVRERMREDVRDNGRVLLVPERPVEVRGRKRFAWWSVEPNGGIVRGGMTGSSVGFFAGEEFESRTLRSSSASSPLSNAADLLAESYASRAGYLGFLCQGLSQLRRVGRALCATGAPRALPKVASCGAAQAESDEVSGGGIGVVGIGSQSCTSRVRQARCGAAAASAFLTGDVQLDGAADNAHDATEIRTGIPGRGGSDSTGKLHCALH